MDIYKKILSKKPAGKVIDIKSFPQIILYGAGYLGKKMYKELQYSSVKVSCFIDKNAELIDMDIPVYNLAAADELADKSIPVLLSGLFDKNTEGIIKKQLYEMGFLNVYSLYQLDWHELMETDLGRTIFIGDYNLNNLQDDIEEINCAYNLLAEDIDREYFLQYIAAYKHYNFNDLYSLSDLSDGNCLKMQYSGNDVPEEMNFKRFLDCGAYDGDALRNLLDNGKIINEYLAFEPQLDLCEKIAGMNGRHSVGSIAAIPCGISDKGEICHFTADADTKTSAKVIESGEKVIQCMSIDMIGDIFKPTFIKMDIEGMELKALKGAANTIRKYQPHMAICVYHDLSHLWKVPLFLHSLNNKYKFYLRNYQIMGLETVLYAIPAQG